MKNALVSCLVFGALAMSTPASAAQILYCSDLGPGTNSMPGALAAVSGTNTITTANGPADFATKLASGAYDLGIFFQITSGSVEYDAAWTALGNFLADGGAAIAGDWTGYNYHGAAFGVTYTSNYNLTSFTINNPSLSAGISSSVTLANPGLGTFSYGMIGHNDAQFSNLDQAIIVNGAGILNGFVDGAFTDPAQGQQLFVNEINLALSAAPVPEPASMLLMGSGLLAAVVRRRRAR